MLRVGVISDTHGLLRPEVVQRLAGCDAILHAGDIGGPHVLDALRGIAPVYAVRGNNDGAWAGALPESLRITLGGTVIFVIHRRADISPAADAAAIVVFGHSHQYSEKIENGRLWLNPGSCGPRRFGREASMALLWIEDNQYRSQKIIIQPETRK